MERFAIRDVLRISHPIDAKRQCLRLKKRRQLKIAGSPCKSYQIRRHKPRIGRKLLCSQASVPSGICKAG